MIHTGDCLAILPALPAESVQCCVTSPPYWGLRDYGVDGQIGLEPSMLDWVDRMVQVFREVHRVLKPDGTLWLNLGDCYAGSGRGGAAGGKSTLEGGKETQEESRKARGSQKPAGFHEDARLAGAVGRAWVSPPVGLKPKDLCGLPWRVAFALQADGWWLRSDIIWHKPNPMPESIKDRPTKAHEYIFLLSKSERYFYDAAAIREESNWDGKRVPTGWDIGEGGHDTIKHNRPDRRGGRPIPHGTSGAKGRATSDENRASAGARFGRGAGWRKVLRAAQELELEPSFLDGLTLSEARKAIAAEAISDGSPNPLRSDKQRGHSRRHAGFNERWDKMTHAEQAATGRNKRDVWTVPTYAFPEAHFATFPPALIEPCILAGSRMGDIVLDPFTGSGTTGVVCAKWGREFIGCELNPEYVAMAEKRIAEAKAASALPLLEGTA